MGPLSVSASIVAIISAASAVAKLIRSVKDPPRQSLELADSVTALERTLEDVHQSQLKGQSLNQGVDFCIRRSEQKLLELSLYLQTHLSSSNSTLKSTMAKITHQDKLKLYKQQISQIRDDLALAFSAATHGQTGRIEMDLQQLVLSGDAALAHRQQTLATLSEQNVQLEYLAEKAAEMTLAQNTMAQILEAVREQDKKSHDIPDEDQSSSVIRLSHSVTMEKEVRQPSERRFSESWLEMRDTPVKVPVQCSSSCRCACHKRRRVSTPVAMRGWFGKLSVTYTGIGPLSPACTVTSCAHGLTPSATVDYTLPSWLASYMISIWLKAAPMQGPELLLRSRRIIETAAYYTAEQGNIVSLRQMYTEGRAGLHDASPISGRTSLFDAICRGHLNIVHFLLDNGADMEQADFHGITPRGLAFQRLHTACPRKLAEELSVVFKLKDIPDELEFTTMHRIVLGMTSLDLNDYLSEHPEEINTTDLLGRTPLWWSVRRDDMKRSFILLENGADPNIANTAGRSPLHNAAGQGNLELVDALLAYDANVNQKTLEGKTPLQAIGAYNVHEQIALRLIVAGSHINGQDAYGRTAISLCCFDSHANIARILLEHDADLSIPDYAGWSPWHWAIYSGAAQTLRLYLEYGCNLSVVIEGGSTILHFTAQRAGKAVVDVLLAEAKFADIVVDAQDSQGMTAEEVLEERHQADIPFVPLDQSTYEAIKRLLDRTGVE